MKKTSIILIVYLLIGVVLFIPLNALSPTDIHGNAKTIELARKHESEYYTNAKIIHSETNQDRTLDFVLTNEGTIYIVSYEHIQNLFAQRYEFSICLERNLERESEFGNAYFVQNNTIEWKDSDISTGALKSDFEPIYWAVLDSSYEVSEIDADAHLFEYEGQQFTLYLKNS